MPDPDTTEAVTSRSRRHSADTGTSRTTGTTGPTDITGPTDVSGATGAGGPTGPTGTTTEVKPKRPLGRTIGIAAFGVVAGLVVIALVAAGFVAFTIQRSFPTLDGSVTAKGLHAKVTVLRDDRGIPTLQADDTHDLFFAQGYVHAQDRFWEMDFRRHVTSGRLSELFGASQLGTDRFLRTLGWRTVAEKEVDLLSADAKAYYQAYADGVNAYLADHQGAAASLEYAVLGLQNPDYTIEKWTIADSLAWLKAMAWDLRSNLEEETGRALLAGHYSAEQIAELYPSYPYDQNPVIVPTLTADAPKPTTGAAVAPALSDHTAQDEASTADASIAWTEVHDVVAAADALVGGAGEGIGSNSWVVSGDLTASGKPLLANDPHLGAAMPSIWHQIGLRCRTVSPQCPFDVAGFGFSGVPGVIIGHNSTIAWGFTNLTTDVSDLYLERVQGDKYWRDGKLVPLQISHETIKVAGGKDVSLEIRATNNGPIISSVNDDFAQIAADPHTATAGSVTAPASAPEGETAVALKWTALTPGTTAEAIFTLDTAQDFAGFRAAAAQFDVPAQNLIYADTDGNIGYQAPGKLPIRGDGDGSMPQPGWDSAYDWKGFIPFDKLPVSYNPDAGYIVTANNAIVGKDYPYFLTNDWDYGWRAARIVDLIQRTSASHKLTVDDMRAIQADTDFWMGKKLIAAYSDISVDDDDVQAALDLFDLWDGHNDAGSAAAAYANVLWDELAQDLFARRDVPTSTSDQARLFLVVSTLLQNPDSPWWTNEKIGVTGMHDMLVKAATDATHRLQKLQGTRPEGWSWGGLHTLTLTSGTFGSSGIPPIEWLFNRGPYPVGGGSSVVDATGWSIGDGFDVVTVPSMRMVIDVADFDASTWTNLSGNSGHAFHPNYQDQAQAWQQVQGLPWAYSAKAVKADATHTLVLTP
ncbi:penicillin acylase family protein [Microbacterium luticocti]|uniref:penicillin acylase family protein n=1 Tax=Microbacterium luticocti TaxID=451764 RepID=UPI000A0755D3|nr:penicillin acylase family protein [Microbacterium luticocti]